MGFGVKLLGCLRALRSKGGFEDLEALSVLAGMNGYGIGMEFM